MPCQVGVPLWLAKRQFSSDIPVRGAQHLRNACLLHPSTDRNELELLGDTGVKSSLDLVGGGYARRQDGTAAVEFAIVAAPSVVALVHDTDHIPDRIGNRMANCC